MERPKVNWRGGLLYALFLEIEVLATGLFLTFAVYPIRMMLEEGALRSFLEIVVIVAIELLVRYFIFYSLFKNQKGLSFGYFAVGYAIAFGIRYIFSFVTSFAFFSASMSVLLTGTSLAQAFINPEIVYMQDVPKLLFTGVFLAFEGISLLLCYLGFKKAQEKREEARQALINN